MFKGRFHGIETEAPRRPQPLLRQACPVLSQATEMLLNDQGQQFWNEAVWVWAVYELLCRLWTFPSINRVDNTIGLRVLRGLD